MRLLCQELSDGQESCKGALFFEREERPSAELAAHRHDDAHAWTRHAHGVVRTTSYGHETITLAPNAAEELSTVVHRQLPCPWALKGAVMRLLTERLKGRELDLIDGIKLRDERGWSQVLPDPDEPLLHVYAEGDTPQVSAELEAEMRALVEQIMQEQESGVAAQISS